MPKSIDVNLFEGYKPHANQVMFHRNPARFKAIAAGTRGGKTVAGAHEFVRRVFQDRMEYSRYGSFPYRQLHYWVVAPDYSLSDVAREEILRILKAEPDDPKSSPFVKEYNGSKLRLTLMDGSVIEFKSAERPEKLVARGLDGVWIDEASRCPAVTWSNLRARVADRQGWALFTTTPMGKNWFYEEVYASGLRGSRNQNADYASFHWTTADNTAVPGLQSEMDKAREALPKRYFMRDWQASFEIFSGQIYDEIDRDIHVKSQVDLPRRFNTVIAGKDWGFSDSHPGVTVVLGQDKKGVWYLLEEIVESRKLLGWWSDADRHLMNRYEIDIFYADPSEPEHIEHYRQEGLPIHEANNRVAPGIQTVATLLHREEMYFSDDCPETIREHENYHYKETRMGIQKEEPDKVDDHTCDAVRYALHTHLSNHQPEILELTIWGGAT